MNYYAHTDKELLQAGIQEGWLAIYTGTVNPRQADRLNHNSDSRNAYVYLWQNGRSLELDVCFQRDGAGLDVLEVRAGEEEYAFLRDRPSGYMRQVAGPTKPIIVANFGAISLRVDTPLGKFTVQAGTLLRLDEDAPRREKKKVLLTLSHEQLLKSAEIWDGTGWRRLNIRREPYTTGERQGFTVLDGAAIVQQAAVNSSGELLMMDSPDPDPDYEIYVTAQGWWDRVTLSFDRRDYKKGKIVQRTRTICSTDWGEPVAYDLQKLRESQTKAEADLCRICLSELPGPPAEGKAHSVDSDILKEFPGMEDGTAAGSAAFPKPDEGEAEEDESEDSALDSLLAKLNGGWPDPPAAPVPDPPEGFPE